MPPKLLKARLSKINDLTPSVRELVFELVEPTEFKFRAGQFVMLHIPQEGKLVQRAYSIASADTETHEFKLVIKYYELGVASSWVKTLKGGEEILYTGPFGKFLFREPPAEQVIHVCTSTGLAPLYGMLKSQGTKFKDTHYKVFMGVWNEKEIFYLNELEALKKNLPNLEINFVLDKPIDTQWKGLSGFVTDHLAKLDYGKPTEFYLCGNPAMIKGVKEMLVAKSFPNAKIYTESYG
jgi:CDP-4-dehydro-6-deoxyglucose reductase, E3